MLRGRNLFVHTFSGLIRKPGHLPFLGIKGEERGTGSGRNSWGNKFDEV